MFQFAIICGSVQPHAVGMPPWRPAALEVSYGAAMSACENRIAWEPALALLEEAKEDLEILMLGPLGRDPEVQKVFWGSS